MTATWECPHCEAVNDFDPGNITPTCGACGRRFDDRPPAEDDE